MLFLRRWGRSTTSADFSVNPLFSCRSPATNWFLMDQQSGQRPVDNINRNFRDLGLEGMWTEWATIGIGWRRMVVATLGSPARCGY